MSIIAGPIGNKQKEKGQKGKTEDKIARLAFENAVIKAIPTVQKKRCVTCDGAGTQLKEVCPSCHGFGFRWLVSSQADADLLAKMGDEHGVFAGHQEDVNKESPVREKWPYYRWAANAALYSPIQPERMPRFASAFMGRDWDEKKDSLPVCYGREPDHTDGGCQECLFKGPCSAYYFAYTPKCFSERSSVLYPDQSGKVAHSFKGDRGDCECCRYRDACTAAFEGESMGTYSISKLDPAKMEKESFPENELGEEQEVKRQKEMPYSYWAQKSSEAEPASKEKLMVKLDVLLEDIPLCYGKEPDHEDHECQECFVAAHCASLFFTETPTCFGHHDEEVAQGSPFRCVGCCYLKICKDAPSSSYGGYSISMTEQERQAVHCGREIKVDAGPVDVLELPSKKQGQKENPRETYRVWRQIPASSRFREKSSEDLWDEAFPDGISVEKGSESCFGKTPNHLLKICCGCKVRSFCAAYYFKQNGTYSMGVDEDFGRLEHMLKRPPLLSDYQKEAEEGNINDNWYNLWAVKAEPFWEAEQGKSRRGWQAPCFECGTMLEIYEPSEDTKSPPWSVRCDCCNYTTAFYKDVVKEHGEVGKTTSSKSDSSKYGPVVGYAPIQLSDEEIKRIFERLPEILEDPLAAGTIRRRHLVLESIGRDEIEEKAILPSHLSDNVLSMLQGEIREQLENAFDKGGVFSDGCVERQHLELAAVGPEEIEEGSVGASHIREKAIGPDHLAESTREYIQDVAQRGKGKIGEDSVQGNHLHQTALIASRNFTVNSDLLKDVVERIMREKFKSTSEILHRLSLGDVPRRIQELEESEKNRELKLKKHSVCPSHLSDEVLNYLELQLVNSSFLSGLMGESVEVAVAPLLQRIEELEEKLSQRVAADPNTQAMQIYQQTMDYSERFMDRLERLQGRMVPVEEYEEEEEEEDSEVPALKAADIASLEMNKTFKVTGNMKYVRYALWVSVLAGVLYFILKTLGIIH